MLFSVQNSFRMIQNYTYYYTRNEPIVSALNENVSVTKIARIGLLQGSIAQVHVFPNNSHLKDKRSLTFFVS